MRGLDFSPYRRSTVGFDRLFDYLENASRAEQDNYPPFDIEKLSDDTYRITLAVAGFKREDIDIVAQQNMLTITGRRSENRNRDGNFLHVGIATRAFERKFELADFVRVSSAELRDGLLSIELIREVPEAMKPRKIEIDGGAPTIESRSTETHRDQEPAKAEQSA
ncbi:MAG TPA: Hsp20 family protein [Allosphingosinicella sp.]|nr:Hsp20 family protein [Allosphingosinicella sp.]